MAVESAEASAEPSVVVMVACACCRWWSVVQRSTLIPQFRGLGFRGLGCRGLGFRGFSGLALQWHCNPASALVATRRPGGVDYTLAPSVVDSPADFLCYWHLY